MAPGGVLPAMSLSQESAHSRMTSVAYLYKGISEGNRIEDDLLFVFAFARESEMVLRLSVRNLVDSKPFIRSAEQTRQMTLHILDVIQSGGKRIMYVNDHDLPICFALIQKRHDSQDLDLFDLSWCRYQFTNLADIERIVVALGLGLGVLDVRILPSLAVSEKLRNLRWALTCGNAP